MPAQSPTRSFHPAAWWVWAIAMGIAATSTTNPLLLGLLVGAVCVVVVSRRPANSNVGFGLYLSLAAIVLVVRVTFRVVLGTGAGSIVLFTLPELSLPDVVAGIRIGGRVTAEGIAAALYDGLRLAALLICIGAANVLADPRRLLRSTPGALYEVGTAVILSLSIAPELVRSIGRVRNARRLRGDERKGLRALRAALIPVLEDALDRSIALAAGMEARGYGRVRTTDGDHRRRAAALLLAGLMTMAVGAYGVLDATTPTIMGTPALLAGGALALLGLRLTGRQAGRTAYRPEEWSPRDTIVCVAGVTVPIGVAVATRINADAVHPSAFPLVWPTVPPLPALAIGLAAGIAMLLTDMPASVRRREPLVASTS